MFKRVCPRLIEKGWKRACACEGDERALGLSLLEVCKVGPKPKSQSPKTP